jgi:EmrB/QacA subfamily drug resistance transporter
MSDTQDRRYILLVTSLTCFSNTVMFSSVVIALPAIGSDLNISAVQLGWIAQAFTLAAAIFVLPSGRLADIRGRKKAYTVGTVIATVCAFLSALSPSFATLIIFRLLHGIGASLVFSTGVALLASVYPPAERGKALGFIVASVHLGLSLGPTIGGILTQNLGWRSVFILCFVLQLPAVVLLFTKIKGEWAEAKGQKFDVIGSALFCTMLFAIIYGFSLLPATPGILTISIGFVLLVIFIQWEQKTESPLFNVRLFSKNRLFVFSNITQFLYHIAIFSISFILSLYLQYIKGFSPQSAGIVLLAQPVMQAALAQVAGRVSDRVQPRIIATLGLVTVLTAILLLLRETEVTSETSIIIALALVGSGAAFFGIPNTNAIMNCVEKKYYGVASAIDSTTRNFGQAFSMGVIMLLFSLYMGRAQITPEHYPAFLLSIRMAFIIQAGLLSCSIVLSALRGKLVPVQE